MRTAILSLLTATSCRNRPWQLAAAVAIGVACGLVPKSSGAFVLLLAMAYGLPIHLMLALAVTGVVTPLAMPLAASLEQLGSYSLNHPQLAEFWSKLDTYALVPWLRLHNTVVHGAVVAAVVQAMPMFAINYGLFAWLAPKARHTSQALMNRRLIASRKATLALQPEVAEIAVEPAVDMACLDTAVAEEQPSMVHDEPPISEKDSGLIADEVQSDDRSSQDQAIQRIEQILSEVDNDELPSGASSNDVLRRAAQLVNAVDDILTAIDAENQVDALQWSERDASEIADSIEEQRVEAVESPLPHVEPGDSSLQTASASLPVTETPITIPTAAVSSESQTRGTTSSEQDEDASIAQGNETEMNNELVREDSQQSLRRTNPRQPSEVLNSPHDVSRLAANESSQDVSVRMRFEQRRVSREGDVLRNLLHHLRDLKEKV